MVAALNSWERCPILLKQEPPLAFKKLLILFYKTCQCEASRRFQFNAVCNCSAASLGHFICDSHSHGAGLAVALCLTWQANTGIFVSGESALTAYRNDAGRKGK